jgi:hypothetical protein
MVRTKIGKYYTERDRKGRLKKWVSIKRALARDRGTKAKRKVRSGYGQLGDQMAWGM